MAEEAQWGRPFAVALVLIALLGSFSACRAAGRAARALDDVIEAGAGRALVRVAVSAAGKVERSLEVRNRYVEAVNQHLLSLERALSTKNPKSVADEAHGFASGLTRVDVPDEVRTDTEALIRALDLLAEAAQAIGSRPTEGANRGCPVRRRTLGGPLSHQAAVLDDVTSLVWRSIARASSHMSR